MAEMTIFDYAREATEVEEKLLMLLDPPVDKTDDNDEPSGEGENTEVTPSD